MSDDDDEPVTDILTRIASVELDIFNNILQYLDCESISHLETTCHNLRNWVQISNIWNRKFEAVRDDIEHIEKEQRIQLLNNSLPATSVKTVLLQYENLCRNLRSGRCKKSKISFYELVGFNGDGAEIKSQDCSLVFVHEDGIFKKTYIHDLHNGSHLNVLINSFPGFSVIHSHLNSGVLAVLRQRPDDNDDDDDDGIVLGGVSILETYSLYKNQYYSRTAESALMIGQDKCLENALKIQLIDDNSRLLVPVYEDDVRTLKLFSFQISGRQILEESVIRLSVPLVPGVLMPQRFEILLQRDHIVWHWLSECVCVWNVRNRVATDHSALEPSWNKDISCVTKVRIPPVTVSSLELSWPHLLLGGSDGLCQVWDCDQDTLLRTLEHDIDSGPMILL